MNTAGIVGTDTIWLLALGGLQLVLILVLLGKSNQSKGLEQQLREQMNKTQAMEHQVDALVKQMKEEAQQTRDLFSRNERDARKELMDSLRQFEEATGRHLEKIRTSSDVTARQSREEVNTALKSLTESTDHRLDKMRESMEDKIRQMQENNQQKLEEMRATVDEKLHKTLETRLGESFKQVSDRLEQVHQGLGEMQTLATGVGDLKKVLSNVKTRGILGEYQLENLLEQLLTSDQYEKNIATRPNSSERVEFAVKMPGRETDGSTVWLPMDAKFPTEDYQQLLDAYEAGDMAEIQEYQKKLSNRIKGEAKSIRDKYIEVPHTTDFAILFLPFEGLYAEVLRLNLFETLQRDYKVMIAGPTTISAFLNSMQMGFRTLAIEKRSSEVWQLLGAVKTEFHKFETVLAKTKKKLEEAGRVIDTAGTRTRAIERKLRDVEELPLEDSRRLLGDGGLEEDEEEDLALEEDHPEEEPQGSE